MPPELEAAHSIASAAVMGLGPVMQHDRQPTLPQAAVGCGGWA